MFDRKHISKGCMCSKEFMCLQSRKCFGLAVAAMDISDITSYVKRYRTESTREGSSILKGKALPVYKGRLVQ